MVSSIEADDPRYSGLMSSHQNIYVVQPGSNNLATHSGRLFTEEGSWHIVGHGYTDPETGGIIGHEYAVGEGAYDGLYALTTLQQKPGSAVVDFKGLIFDGGLPETPEAAPDEMPAVNLDQ